MLKTIREMKVFMLRIFAFFIVFFASVLFSAIIDVSAAEPTAQNFLTHTLNEPIGMQGWEYALGEPYEIVEIVVQFRTPPAVALRLIQEHGGVHGFSEAAFEQQALVAHEAFYAQLNQVVMPFGDAPATDIIGEHHRLFNGVFMRVPVGMVEMIAGLPEVFGVFPNVALRTAYTFITEMESETETHINPGFMREAREYLGMDYINNDLGLTGYGVRVAVLDTGIYHNHPEFIRFQDPATGLIRGGERFCNAPSTNPHHFERGHGTTVSGAVVGIAPGVELWHYRVDIYERGDGFTPIAAIEAAHEDGMQVINLSFGAAENNAFFPLNSVVNLAVMDGIVVVVAAGNIPAHMPRVSSVWSPGTAPLAITVGAGEAGDDYPWISDELRHYSARGPVLPTFHIKPDIIVTTGVTVPAIDGGFATAQGGTSHSSPIIAGLAALILQQHPNAAPWEVKARIMNTARPMPEVNPASVFCVGAGFSQPLNAVTQENFATVKHPVPVTSERDAPFAVTTMASLSFGDVFGETQMSVKISGTEAWEPHAYFNGSHDGVEIFVERSGENTFAVRLEFASGAEVGSYQGNIVFTSGAGRITMPFAARYNGERLDITDRFECANLLEIVRELVYAPYPRRIYRHMVTTLPHLYAPGRELTSLAGLEYFNLTTINVNDNNLTEIDLSAHTMLWLVSARNNNLAKITTNTRLWDLDVSYNNLTSIDVSGISNLGALDVRMNFMESPDDVIGWQEHFPSVGTPFRFFPQQPIIAPPNTIAGSAMGAGPAGSELAGAIITLVDIETAERTAVTTIDANGLFAFSNVPNGTYLVVSTMNNRWSSVSRIIVMDNDFHMVNFTQSSSGGATPLTLLVRLTGLPNQNPPGTDVRVGTARFARFTAPIENATDDLWRFQAFPSDAIGTLTATSPGFASEPLEITAADYVNHLAVVILYLNELPIIERTVIFNPNGGVFSNTDYKTRRVVHGDGVGILPMATPSIFSRENFRFTGWFENSEDESTRWRDNDEVTGDVTLYAGWRQTPDNFLLGDANRDGRVTSADATQIARWLVAENGRIPLHEDSPPEHLAADINGDGAVTLDDLTLLARWLVGHRVEHLIAR